MYQRFWGAQKAITLTQHKWQRGNRENSLSFSSALLVDGIIQEGFTLKGSAIKDLPNCHVSFVISHKGTSEYGKGVAIARADWKPLRIHNNRNFGEPEYRFLDQETSHYHDFTENYELGDEIWVDRKLPIAYPINPEPATFENFLEFTGEKFRIGNISSIPIPPWNYDTQSDLF